MSDVLGEFEANRERLFAVAYRMLGSVADAEDVVQDAFLRWTEEDRTGVRSPAAFLTTIVTRLSVDRLRSLKAAREEYIGPWLPEPLPTRGGDAVDGASELAESVTMAFLVLLERLAPLERAVFLLHDVFGYSFSEIGEIVERNEASCRQLAHRARERLAAERPRFEVTGGEHHRLAEQFLDACRSGDLDALMDLLTDDVVLQSDGGGKVTAARRPIAGADAVGRFIVGVLKKSPPGFQIRTLELNGQVGLVAEYAGEVVTTWTLRIESGKIRGLYVMRNPDKLARLHGPGREPSF